jgi:hypothetical protein
MERSQTDVAVGGPFVLLEDAHADVVHGPYSVTREGRHVGASGARRPAAPCPAEPSHGVRTGAGTARASGGRPPPSR